MRKLTLSTLSGWVISACILCFASVFSIAQCPSGTVAGIVYLDGNNNGSNNTEAGYPNALVTIYDDSNTQVGMALTNGAGEFSINGLIDGSEYRVEYSYAASVSATFDQSKESSDVQFIESPSCNLSFGITNRSLSCGDTDDIVLTCFVRSDGTDNLGLSTIIGLEYDYEQSSTPIVYATQAETGSVWGTAYKNSTDEIFTSAFIKQNSSLGSSLDAIYRTVPSGGGYTTSVYTTLSALGQTTASLSTTDAYDCTYGDQVGHEGLGGLAISADGDDLYVVNISDNTLVKFSSSTPVIATTSSYSIPDPGCNTDENRPFALTEYNGKYYVGVTCTAESVRASSQSSVTVYEFDPVLETFLELFSTSETIGYWSDTPTDSHRVSQWLTDIAFTDEENMVIALSDRKGHRYCSPAQNLANEATQYLNDQEGDILLVVNQNGSWVLESNGQAGPYSGSGIGNGDGPNGGEFFGDDFWLTDPDFHNETSLGSIYALPGSGEIVSAVFDPITEEYSGGLHRYQTLNGDIVEAIQLYDDNRTELFGKATGFGGITGKCGYTGIEIGNFAWIDLNNNGIQEPGEDPINNLPLLLYDETCTLVSSTSTNSDGHYSFTDEDGLRYGSTYFIIIDPTIYDDDSGYYQFNNGNYTPTLIGQDVQSGSDMGLHSSDCDVLDNVSAITVQIGGNAENDYSYDIGMSLVQEFDLALILTSDVLTSIEGQDVKYTVYIENQGDITANNIKVMDYIPEGMELNDENWILDEDGKGAYTYINIEGGLAPGENYEECITLKTVAQGDDHIKINYAEIAYTENLAGLDYSQNDVDSTPDEIIDNDFGGEAFSNNDNRLSGIGISSDDEDDHDPEGLYFASISNIGDPCLCQGIENGVAIFSETITVNGPSGQDWEVIYNNGLHAANGILYPVGTSFVEISTFTDVDGMEVAIYELSGIRYEGESIQIRVRNEEGVFLQIESVPCLNGDLTITPLSGDVVTSICLEDQLTETYAIALDLACTYAWDVDGAISGITVNADGTATIDWVGIGAGEHIINVTPTCLSDACAPIGSLSVTVGGSNGILACPLDINVSLDGECSLSITPEMILTSALTTDAAYGIMIIDEHGNVLPDNIVSSDYLGETLEVKVIDACTGNACWSNLYLEDKIGPTIQCEEDIVVACYDVNSYMPFAIDNCTEVEVIIISETPTPLWCHDDYIKTIDRTYQATDANGMTATCSQVISVSRFPYDQITKPDEEVKITCTQANDNQNTDGFPSPCLTGVPELFGSSLYGEDSCDSDFVDMYCEIAFSYDDVLYYQGECLTKYMRTWHYYENNCIPWTYENFTQLIIIEDNDVPVFDTALSIHTEILSTGANSCETFYTLPAPVVSDDCAVALKYDVTITTEDGVFTFFNDLTSNEIVTTIVTLPFGINTIEYLAKDGCDNRATDEFTITVVDSTSPTAVCEGNTVISLNEDGEAYAFASTFDDGSHDDCSDDVQLLVKRESKCDCEAPIIDNMNYLGEYIDVSGDTHYYYNSSRLVQSFLADNLSDSYGGYLVDFNTTGELEYISSLMMMDAYVADDSVLSGGVMSVTTGIAQLSFVVEIEDPCSWSQKIHFCCEDYDADNTTSDVIVSVRVIDAFGNYTDCNPTNVYIQNKVIPLLDCPSDISLTCSQSTLVENITTEDDLNEMFGTFSTDVCGAVIVPTSVWDLNTCGIGTIERTFSAANENGTAILDNDGNAVSCAMVITIQNDVLLTQTDIDWPDDLTDVEVGCVMTETSPQMLEDAFGEEFGFPIIASNSCIDISIADPIDSAPFISPDGRIKIIRTWVVTDHCNNGIEYTHVQKLKFIELGTCNMLDVALRKTIITPSPYTRGDQVTFQIEVFNQGSIEAFNIGVIDYIPDGLTFALGTTNNADWTSVDANTALLSNPIASLSNGNSTTLLIDLVIDSDAISDLSNFAEISSVDDDIDVTNGTGDDSDSTPDTINSDVLTDDEIDLEASTGDEDDHDVATIFVEVFDLALIKTVNATNTDSPVVPGGSITFDIRVYNQGNVEATDIQIIDYTPTGLVFEATDNTDWIENIDGTVSYNGGLSLMPGENNVVQITYEVDEYANLIADGVDLSSVIVNRAEILSASGGDDIDSTPDNDVSNDAGGTPDSDEDDQLDGDGIDDEDDSDPATFTIDFFDLALTKVIDASATAMPIAPGSNVTFEICVLNQGTIDASDVVVTDYIPNDMSFVSSPDFILAGTDATTTIDDIAVGDEECVSITLLIDPSFAGLSIINDAEITNDGEFDDVDSMPNSDTTPDDLTNDNDIDAIDGGDDQDPAQVVFESIDLDLVKSVSESKPNIGDIITYTITISNQGPDIATNVSIEDIVPNGLSNVTNISSSGILDSGVIEWSGVTIAVGGSLNFTYNATVEAPLSGITYENVAQVTGHDQFDTDSMPNNDDGDQSEDDEDSEDIAPQVVDLELLKTVSNSMPNVGDVITYTITVENKGTSEATNVSVEDILPTGLSNVMSISDSGMHVSGVIEWSGLSIPSNGSISLSYNVTVVAPGDGIEYNNVAQVTGVDQYDMDSTPDNDDGDQSEDDEDPEVIIPQEVDLELTKTVNDSSPNVGDVISYTITVENNGTSEATNVSVEDILPTGLSNVTSISDSGMHASGVIDWSGLSIPSNGSIVLTYDVTVVAPGDGIEYENVAQVTDVDQYDIDSTPDNDDGDQSEDDEDPEVITPQVADLELTKTVSNLMPLEGDVITYTITLENLGPNDATNVAVEDIIPNGLGNIINISDNGSMVMGVIEWSGLSIADGGTILLTYDATVQAQDVGVSYLNIAQVTDSDQFDIDSTPNNDDGDQSEDEEDAVSLSLDCTVPSCGLTEITVVLPASGSVLLYPYIDASNSVQLSTTPVADDGIDGCEAVFTVVLDDNEILCNPPNSETVKVTITDVINGGTPVCCSVNVIKTDVIPPVLTNCDDETRICNTILFNDDGTVDTEPFDPDGSDNCPPVDVIATVVDVSDFDFTCNTGDIVITYTATDDYNNSVMCTKTVTVDPIILTVDDITFPSDFVLAQCGSSSDVSITGEPTVAVGSTCDDDQLSITFMDSAPIAGTCQEEFTRTWTVSDNCGNVSFTDTQLISFVDDEGPIITLPTLSNIFEVLPPTCIASIDINATISDACGSAIDSMYYIINNDTIFNSIEVSGDFDFGVYVIDFVGVDVCGNKTVEELSFTVADPSTPLDLSCLKLTFEVGPDGPTIISADELAFNGFGCSDEGFEYQFIAGTPGVDIAPDDPVVVLGDQSIDCNTVDEYFIYVGLFEDGVYNGDFCVAQIDPVDINPQDCPTGNTNGLIGNVFGTIMTESGDVIPDVEVQMMGDMTDMKMTSNSGGYAFNSLSMGGTYRVTPSKDTNHRNGVTTLDIIMVQRHILGLQTLASPYQHIAADVSKNGQISAQDIVEMRKLVLEVYDRFPSNESYRLLDANYSFIDGVNPLQENFPERYDIYEFQSDMNIDFVGVKIGDVNNSAIITNTSNVGLQDIAAQTRGEQALLAYTNEKLSNGVINLTIESGEKFLGFQTQLRVKGFDSNILVESELPGFDQSHYNVSDGVITISYFTPTLELLDEGLITLSLQRSIEDSVSEILDLEYTYPNELYTDTGMSALRLSEIDNQENGFVVYQNNPNPFTDHTDITFELEEISAISLHVYSPDGKVILHRVIEGQRGLNTLTIANSDLPTEGIYYYELDNGQSRVMKRMLKVN